MNRGASPLLDEATDLVLDSLALVLGDHLALGVGLEGADLLHVGGARLVLDRGALLLVNSSLDSPRHNHTALLGNAVTLVLKHLLALLLHISGGLTLPLELDPALLLGLSILIRTQGNLTLPLVSLGVLSVHIVLEAGGLAVFNDSVDLCAVLH